MSAIVGGTTILASMNDKGDYRLHPQEVLDDDGTGTPILAPFYTMEWTWEELTPAEFSQWATTILGGARSAVITSITLPLDDLTSHTFARGRVWRPEANASPRMGMIRNVTVRITDLEW